ncbi:MAG: 1-acyl-sn-glycerol-3-phosphate acyltransferase [Anaerolineales bacterium]|nr:1-acyl-sn-glycerol-3-phosphate acyltransferase [Anaerolineales bacterium]
MTLKPALKPSARRARFFGGLARCLARLLIRLTVHGQDHVPPAGPLLVTMNHLGGADPVLCLGYVERPLTIAGKAEIMRWPVLGALVRGYGMIPLRRGEPDRATLKLLLGVLEGGGALLIAPEGRESLSGALEAGKTGPAFLALRAAAAILPVAITGTAWRDVLPAWRRLRRPRVTLTFGPSYHLPAGLPRRAAADEIMRRIAALLPAEYRGVYAGEPRPDEPAG